ncbi:MAG: hypothetical protein HY746_09985 [Elusimicrobia bacterium]|nr:hypothetical protein [Elusimicrobiota bacterium]
MTEEKEKPNWRKRFLANRMAFESILFEKELVSPKPEKKSSGLIILFAIFLFHSLLLTQAALRGGGNFPREDAAAVETAYQYVKAIDSGRYLQLFKPENFSVSGFKPPLYYLSFYPLLKLFPSNPALVLAVVNSFYLLLIMLFMYFAVSNSRGFYSGWFTASLSASFPVIILLGRHASPDIALMAFVAGIYCCYINSKEFEIKKWSVLFGICFTLGLLSDVRFIIYALPVVHPTIDAFLNSITRKNITPFYVLLLLLPAPWYLRNFAFSFFRDLFVRNDFREALGIGSIKLMNILYDLPLLVDYMHLPVFCICMVSILWFCMSVFMTYEGRKIALIWFLFPYCVFSLFSRAGGGNIYPALLPFAMAAGIMMPNMVRKPMIGLTLLLAMAYQSGFVPGMDASIGAKRIGIFGMDFVRVRDIKTEDALKAVYAAGGGRNVRVQLIGDDDYFNPDSLRLITRKLGYPGMSFVRYSKDYMGLADFVIYKTAGFAENYKSGVFKEYSEEISAAGGWFSSVFSPLVSFDLADTSRLSVYVKSYARPDRLAPGNYIFPRFSAGAVTFENVIVDVGPFRESDGTYEFFEIFIPQFKFYGADLYSLRFRFKDFAMCPVSKSFSDVRLTGCDSVRILLLRLREETMGRLLQVNSPYFQNLSVRFDNGLSILSTYHGLSVNLGFSVIPTEAGFKLKLARMYLGMLGMNISSYGEGFDAGDEEEEIIGKVSEEEKSGEPSDAHYMDKLQKDIAQFTDDAVTAKIIKSAGYSKLIERASEIAKQKQSKEKPPKRVVQSPSADSAGLLSAILVRLFSMDFDFLNEKTVPFKVQVSKIYLRNGLLTVR